MLFSTSWDDGHILDTKLTGLLARHGVQGTLYVSPSHPTVAPVLSAEDIRTLSGSFEIGAHTMTHPDLTAVTPERAREEIITSKQWVESVTGKECCMFCYPKGRWNPAVRDLAQMAGFTGARMIEAFHFRADDPWALPVSLHIYPFPLRPIVNRRCFAPLARAWRGTRGFGMPLTAFRGWLPFAKALFNHATTTHQPWFHLWGHSWEIEKFGMWDALETFLLWISKKPDTIFVPNSALLPITES